MNKRILLILLTLSGCAAVQNSSVKPKPSAIPTMTTQSAGRLTKVITRTVIRREKSPPCVKPSQIPEEPPLIGGKLVGLTHYDIGPLIGSARELRTTLREALGLLKKCAK